MRVLAAVVVPPHLRVSGAVTAALALSRAVAETGDVDVDVALMATGTSTEPLGRARLLRRRARNPVSWTRAVLPDRFRTLFWTSDIPRRVHDGGYDLVHLHNPLPALELRRVARAARDRCIPYVISTHGFVEIAGGERAYDLRGARRIAWDRWVRRPFDEVVAGAARVLALSPEERPILRDLGVGDERIAVVSNGVDLAELDRPDPEADAALRERFDLPARRDPDAPLCAFLGNHTRNKGIDVLLEGMTAQDRPFLLVVGGMKKPHNVRYDAYADRAAAGHPQRIVFTDLLDDREARALMRLADLFVFPTRADTLPLVILEAMACRTPVLATRVGGIPYQIDEGCGRLVEPDDARALADGYRTLYDERARFAGMGAAARQRVERRFDWAASARDAVAVYRELVPACAGSSASR